VALTSGGATAGLERSFAEAGYDVYNTISSFMT
jgi:hypothetical protein